ncbi:MAG: hypothetical protein AB1806_20845 [Acidobacteriota bacterium]
MEAERQTTLLDLLCHDPVEAGTGPGERAMLAYAVKLTREPASITADDVRSLRDTGFDDRAIHDICAIVAYFAFVNRLADGLGVELESRFLA